MDLSDAYELGRTLMNRHGLADWQLGFDSAKRRAGACRHARRTITLSAPLTRLHDEHEVRETILHEIAHALAGPEHAHGPAWREVALRIGSKAERCVPEDLPTVPGAWLGVCARGHTTERHRRPERVLLCRQCADAPELERVFEWTHHGQPAPMHPNYESELEDLRRGARSVRLGPGHLARITADGEFHGRVGAVIKRGRTSYHLRLPDGQGVRVLFAAVEPVVAEQAAEHD